ncbi:MAG: RluA family pseudouridine synthase [Clostridia bacterium]|nr:RluA family pseudouridine synthase [Clostridia bacterium]MDY4083790.1 RluA family pseudouridine synthase [Eubacteriales bacterium]
MNSVVIGDTDVGKRLDLFLSEEIDESRSYVKNLTEQGLVLVNGKSVKAGYSVKKGDVVEYELPEIKQLDLAPADIPIDVVYEDDDVAVINKAQGMVVHPAPGSYDNTLVNALLFRLKSLSSINGVARPGIVHRLDKDTSGLLVVAKNDEAHVDLQSQIASKEAKRYYIALVDGVINKDEGVIDTYIDRSQKDRKMMAVSREGKGRRAITHYKVLERLGGYSLVEYELKTGRTHQIRVHSKHIGHPIVGDRVYGGSTSLYDQGQLLHAFRLQFTHPRTKRLMSFEAPLPKYFSDILAGLREKYAK